MQCRFRPCCEISIHSLVKRETGLQIVCRLAISNFNPLPRKEGDCKKAVQSLGFAISIHSLVKRETDTLPTGVGGCCDFNPLPRKEGDWHAQQSCIFNNDFNPLPRKEGDPGSGSHLSR